MSAAGFTPIQLYRTTTASAVPSAGNLADGELAINLTDEALYFKNAAGVVKLLADSSGALGSVTSVNASGGTTGLTFSGGPITSSGTLTLGGTLAVANGGTGVTVSTGTGRVVLNDSPVFVTPSLGVASATSIAVAAGAIAYTFSGDTNTGMWSPAADTLTFSTDGNRRLTVDSAGLVGVGTSTPTSNLHVNSFGNTILRISTSFTNSATTGIVVDQPGDSSQARIQYLKGGVSQGLFRFVHGATVSDQGFDLNISNVNTLEVRYDQTVFRTGTAERMRIDSSGQVGIGTTAPASLLHLQANDPRITLRDTSGTSAATNYFQIGQAGANGEFCFLSADPNNVQANTVMQFSVDGSERMRIDNSGNVGIGTSAPATRLEVAASGNTTVRVNSTNAQNPAVQLLRTGGSGYQMVADTTVTWSVQRIDSSGTVTATPLSIALSDVATFTGALRGPSGSAASPAFSFSADTNTGIFRAAEDNLAFATGGSERARIDTSGNLLVGKSAADFAATGFEYLTSSSILRSTASGGFAAQFNRLASDGDIVGFYRGGTLVGSISVTGSATAYNTSSDYRLKDIDGPIQNSGAYIDALKPVRGSWKADGSRFIGLLAHEVQEVSETQIATGEKDGEEMQAMDYSAPEIIANLIAEIQSLRARVAQLEGN